MNFLWYAHPGIVWIGGLFSGSSLNIPQEKPHLQKKSTPHRDFPALALYVWLSGKEKELYMQNSDGPAIEQVFQKFLNDNCTGEELEILLDYFGQPGNEVVSKEMMDAFWQKIGDKKLPVTDGQVEKRFKKITAAAEKEEQLYHRRSRKNAARTWYRAVAAIVLVLVATGAFYYLNSGLFSGETVVYLEKVNPPGQKSSITLGDGTEVLLNAGSKLIYPEQFTGDTRELILEGEAFFAVTENKEKPFIVKTRELRTTVLGTSFNIDAFADSDIRVTVATGKVSVVWGDAPPAPLKGDGSAPAGARPRADAQVLVPGEQVLYSEATNAMLKRQVNIEKHIAWKDGALIFDNKKLSEVATMLERWYGVKITIEDEKLGNCVIMGEHQNEPLVNVLKAMRFAIDIDYEFAEGVVRISGKGCDS